jgi:hypothetical protein
MNEDSRLRGLIDPANHRAKVPPRRHAAALFTPAKIAE